jgi:hypothetical protein
MRARGRSEAAKEQARALVNKLRSGERACIIALGSEAIWLTDLTADHEKLLEAIERYQPLGGAVDYGAGIAEIIRRLGQEPQAAAEADIISDFQESGLEELSSINSSPPSLPSFLRLNTYPVGSRVERNAFLLDEMLGRTERGIELTVSEIISERNGHKAQRHAWTIDESNGATNGLEWSTEGNNQITGHMKIFDADDFDADDEKYFAFAPTALNRTLLIEDGTDASLYLRAALEASAGENATTQSLPESRARLPEKATDLASYSLVILTLHGAADMNEQEVLAEYVRAGGIVWMFLGRDLDTASWNRLAEGTAQQDAFPFQSITRKNGNERLRFGAVDTEAPELRRLDQSALAALGAVGLNESYEVVPQASSDILMRWSDNSPALIHARMGKGRMLLMTTSLERASGELGHSPAFPALTASILRDADTSGREPLSQTIGEPVRLSVSPEADVQIRDTKGQLASASARELITRPLAYFKEPGIYQLEFAGEQKFIAFNAPARESERELVAPDKLQSYFPITDAGHAATQGLRPSREALERNHSLWRYFLCAAFLFLVAELFVAIRQRKIVEG